MNATIEKFGYPATLLRQWEHWVLLLRPAQPTLGSCVLAAKSDAIRFGDLSAEAHAELKSATGETEAMLTKAIGYEKLNYLMLMMVDPHVHFHVIPRYGETRSRDGVDYVDAGWPKMPDLGAAVTPAPEARDQLIAWLKSCF
ncbi:HIT family protein [Stakelama sp. CBK3Z-3]|uniref:HIT family protein n=1 Tax=Stakelama flava TaxID=2860338 RepID=A0ABS6XM61_9SPHN|nr:HIT family protein [Stakelama flava]MBW4331292.1 HIT family protein [Stakelama flava]